MAYTEAMSQIIRAKKYWSQNFFQDPELLALSLDPLELEPTDTVIEVGPGQGVLTELLLERVQRVIAIEVDPQLFAQLRQQYAHESRLELLHQDVMRADFRALLAGVPWPQRKLVANIPYHLTTPLLHKALNIPALAQGLDADTPIFSDIGLMVQKEVAEKLVAQPGEKAYGVLSIQAHFAAENEILSILPRHLFQPQPKVDSAFVRLQPRQTMPISATDLSAYWQLVQAIYQQRRKTLRNVLRKLGHSSESLEQLGAEFDLTLRGEVFGLEDLARLNNARLKLAAAEV